MSLGNVKNVLSDLSRLLVELGLAPNVEGLGAMLIEGMPSLIICLRGGVVGIATPRSVAVLVPKGTFVYETLLNYLRDVGLSVEPQYIALEYVPVGVGFVEYAVPVDKLEELAEQARPRIQIPLSVTQQVPPDVWREEVGRLLDLLFRLKVGLSGEEIPSCPSCRS